MFNTTTANESYSENRTFNDEDRNAPAGWWLLPCFALGAAFYVQLVNYLFF